MPHLFPRVSELQMAFGELANPIFVVQKRFIGQNYFSKLVMLKIVKQVPKNQHSPFLLFQFHKIWTATVILLVCFYVCPTKIFCYNIHFNKFI